MDRDEYHASVSSVQHGLAPEFRRLLSCCGAEASAIIDFKPKLKLMARKRSTGALIPEKEPLWAERPLLP